MRTRILLADDHQILRQGLRTLLESMHGFEVVGEAENGREAVRLACELRPDVILMDVGMKDVNGMDATRQIVDQCAGLRVVGLSLHSDRAFVTGMLEAGASGYLLKQSAFEEVVEAIRQVRANRIYISPSIADLVVSDYVRALRGQPASPGPVLTPREREVVQLLAEGRSCKQIAQQLQLSVKTVETHRQHITEKLGTHSLAELTKFAIREGLTSLDP